MIRRKLHKLYAVIGVGLVSYGSTALAAPVTVNNASFEAPDLHSGGNTWSNEIGPDWALGGAAPAGDSFIEFIGGFAADGVQHIGLQNNRFIVQDTGVPVEPYTTYTLRVGVGNRNAAFSPAGALAVVGLTNQVPAADDTTGAMAFLAASKTVDSGPPQAEATFVDVVVTITTGAEVEGNVVIVLGDDVSAGRAHFDNVRLDATPSYIVNKTAGSIVADGDLSDWAGANQIVNPEFTLTTEEALSPFGQRITHEAFDGGVWDGLADHSATVMALYDDENIYLAFVVTDDYHSNPGASGWNGDAAQLMIANGARDAQVALYNYALGGVEGALTGAVTAEHEARPTGGPDTAAGITRSGTTTTYEIRIPKAAAGLASLVEGAQFGFAVSINDGDEATPGQKGWSGINPGALVRGKNANLTELFTLGTVHVPASDTIVFNGGSIKEILGPDDLHLDPSAVVIAVDIFGDEDREVNGVTFQTDKPGNKVVVNGDVKVTTTATNSIDGWTAAPNFVGGQGSSAANLAQIMRDIRWEGAPNPINVEIAGLKPGAGYEVQILVNEGADRNRHWDIGVGVTPNIELVVDNFTSEGEAAGDPGTGGTWSPNNSFVYTAEFTADGAGVINLVMQKDIAGAGGTPAKGADNNPILQAVIVHRVQSGTPLIACWAFDGNANDDVSGLTGAPTAGVTYTNDSVRGRALTGGSVFVANGSLFNAATAADQISISFWQKTPDTTDASSFWFRSPSSSAGQRGLQAHVPWSNGTIYFDTAGCCDPPQRINADPTGFNGFAWKDTEYHHFVFVKDGADKRIYVDGELFHDQSQHAVGAAPLPSDITSLWIGSESGGTPIPGSMDEFAVWGGALTDAEIAELAAGADPKTLGGRENLGPDPDLDGLLDAWEMANIGNTDSGADDDNDGDGQTNKEEQRNGTNPLVADTDGDGLTDGEEEALGINPTKADTDGDGLSDSFEVSYGTWPGQRDTDGDGLADGLELCYAQDFQLADGTANLGDGSIVNNNQQGVDATAGTVQGGKLLLTKDGVNSQQANYLLPSFGALAADGFTVKFDLTLFDAAGDNPPADGFSFNFGAIGDGASTGEEGHADGLVVSFDTWDNGGDEAAEGGSGTGIGVDIKIAGGANIAINRIDPAEDKNNNSIFNFDNVSRQVVITYLGNGTSGLVTVTLGDKVLHSSVPVPWAPEAGDRIAFGARTGGANEQVAFDNLGVACSGYADPLAKNVSAIPGLCHQWWKVGNPGNKDAVFAVINGGNPTMGTFKGSDAGGTGTWWTGNGTNIGIQNYPAALGFSATHNEENYLAYLTGEINIPEAGVYKFKDGVDDYTYLAIDLNGNGINGEADDGTGQSEVLIDDNAWTGVLGADNGGSPIAERTITPGWKAIEFVSAEGGGGDAGVLYWDYSTAGIGTGVGFPAVSTAAIDAANAQGLLIPDTNLRCFPKADQYAGLCQQWWDVNNPGNKDAVFSVINGGNPNMGVFKGTDAGGSGTWWTGNGTNLGIQNYPAALGFPAGHNEESYIAYLTGEINIPEEGVYKFKDGVDDYTYLAIDLNGNGINGEADDGTGQSEVLIDDNAWTGVLGADNGGSPIAERTITPGWKAIEFVSAEGGGGDAGVLYWDYTTAGIGTGVGFPTVFTAAIDVANAPGLLIPDSYLRCVPTDTDGDGILDALELAWFGDLSQDMNDDSDGDRAINADEFALGTNPSIKDTDGDGLWDGEEWIEVGLGTLPSVKDTDGDGLSDGFELRISGTNPNDPDSDGDGLSDGFEVENSCLYFQNFNHLADGTTNLGDGSIVSSAAPFTAKVSDKALQMTITGIDSQNATYRLPNLGDIGGDFAVAFDYSLAGGGARPADGFSFNFGAIGDDETTGTPEEGFGKGLAVEFDTWDGGPAGKEDLAANGIGIDVSVNGVTKAFARAAAGADPTNNEFFVFDGASHHVEIISEGKFPSELPKPLALFKLDFGNTPNSPGPANGTAEGWNGIDNLPMDTAVAVTDSNGAQSGVTITALDDGFNPNNSGAPGAGAAFDGVEIPQNVNDDYLFKIADTPGTSARIRVDGLAAGVYNVTLFEGRTTDSGQSAVLWAGADEPAAANSGSFANGGTTTTIVVGAGQPLYYKHLEDGSGGISGIVIRQVDVNLAQNLVSYWPLDSGPEDVVGVHDGVAMGAAAHTYDAGKLGGGGVDLDGVDQFIQISGDENVFDFQGGTGFTISAWFRVDAFTKSWQALIAKGEGNRWRIHRRGADSPNVFAANGGNGDVPAYSGAAYPIDDGKYHHIAMVSVPGDRVEMWIDGDLVSTGPAPTIENGGNPMAIGENPDALGRTWNGGIDDVGAWDRPLTAAEIGALWNGGSGASIGQLTTNILTVTETNIAADAPAVISSNFGEDALSFSDRTHQHNGAAFDAAGLLSTTGTNIVPLPSYLVGGDYVRFANDARENVGFGAVVTAKNPTNWYLLIDNRLDGVAGNGSSPNTVDPVLGGTLQWVIDGGWQRVNTGISPNGQADYTGVDEGGDGVGAGAGLNQFYAVYTLPSASTSVSIGGPQIGGNNMLALVGVPSTEILNTITVKVDGKVIHDSVVVDFDPSAADRIAFAARTGGAHETLFIDNVCVVSGTELPASPSNPLIADPDAISRDPLLAASNVVFGGQLGADAFTFGVEGTAGDTNNWPGGEAPGFTIDGFGQKYLNFGKLNTGIVVIPAAPSVASAIKVWAANDAVERDPSSYSVYGTNADLSGATGNVAASEFTLISSGGLALPDSRNAGGAATALDDVNANTVLFGNTTKYAAYMIVFPTIKDAAAANSMQLADVQLLGTMDPVAIGLLASDRDSDGDGNSDNAERVAGTNPYDAREFFHMSEISYGLGSDGNPTLVLGLATVPDQTYVLQFSPTMEPGTWENVDAVTAEDTSSVFEIMNPRAFQRTSGFFRSILVEQN